MVGAMTHRDGHAGTSHADEIFGTGGVLPATDALATSSTV